jgi:uncharacterized membrane protein YbhN (UPF0104 family)
LFAENDKKIMIKILKRVFPVAIIIIIFIFLLRSLILNWSKIPFDDLHFNIYFLIISFLCLIPHFLSYGKSWQEVMRALGSPITFTQSCWMIATTQIAKYIPGRVWYMVGRVYVGKKEKMSGESLAVSMIMDTCLLIISVGSIFLISTIIAGNYSFTNLLICSIPLLIAFIILIPRILSWIIKHCLRILKKPMVELTLSYLQNLKLSIWFFILWFAQIIGFYFLINAIYTVSLSEIFTLAAAYALSWLAGFVVIFAPGGLGVREGMMTLLLSSILPTSLAIAISFIARVWITIFEIFIFFIGLVVKKKASS